MNDPEIRQCFHKKMLRRYHADQSALVLDELGLMHGAYRADIAIVNGKLIGFEIKSDGDSLYRLKKQIAAYNSVFDRIAIVVSERHRRDVTQKVPKHWGIVVSKKGKRGAIHFKTQRKSKTNPHVDPMSVAQLLWKGEAIEILQQEGAPRHLLNSPRIKLYRRLSKRLPLETLKLTVRTYLKSRSNWRCLTQPFLYDDSCQPTAKS
jgi:hypothetical protein